MRDFNVYIGAIDWEHADWGGTFYPDGLPEDWKLSFYNIQLRCVYLPYQKWHEASNETVANWLNETREEFHFVLGMPNKSSDSDEGKQAARFGKRGVLASEIDIVWLDQHLDLRELAGRIKMAVDTGRALYLIAKENGLAQLRQAVQLLELVGA